MTACSTDVRPLGFGCEVERIASPSENPSDDDNEADDGQDGPNDAHVRSLLLLLVFLGGLLEMRYQCSDGSDGIEV
jgi:hypothetical protein